VVLVDSLDPDQAHTVFGRLRDEVWQLPYTWVVAGDERARGSYLSPPADAFFDVVLSIPAWKPDDLEEVLKRRLPPNDLSGRARRVLATLAHGNPRRLLSLARASVIEGHDPLLLAELRAQREAKAAELGRDHSMALAELEEAGAVSASDEEFLRRMGWPRERAARVLKDLERAGLARGVSRPGESGRPRRFYEVRDLPSVAWASTKSFNLTIVARSKQRIDSKISLYFTWNSTSSRLPRVRRRYWEEWRLVAAVSPW
jgi:hypothetical protein